MMILLWVTPFTLDRMRWSRPNSCVWAVANNRQFVLFVAIAGYHGPSILMIICYIQVYRAMRKAHVAVGVDTSKKKKIASQPTTVSVIDSSAPQKSLSNNDGGNAQNGKESKTNGGQNGKNGLGVNRTEVSVGRWI